MGRDTFNCRKSKKQFVLDKAFEELGKKGKKEASKEEVRDGETGERRQDEECFRLDP